jgi:protein AroM
MTSNAPSARTPLGLVTIGQAPRSDVVPDMAELLGSGVEIVERGALDGLERKEIDRLAPQGDDEVLVTRLADGSPVFVGKPAITPLVQRQIEALETQGVAMTVLLCTGAFEGLRPSRPLIEPDKVLLGVIRGVRFSGRLGVLTPSARHVEQTKARWRAHGFDPVVLPASPYESEASAGDLARRFRAGGAGFVLLDCIGFRRALREDIQAYLGVPVVVPNLLVARVVAEMLGA